MKRTAALVTLVMIGMGFVPMAAGNHMSVGNQDAVAMGPSETPGDKSVSDAAHARGTTPTGQCYDDEGTDLSSNPGNAPGRATGATTSDAFCGRLDYNPGTNFNWQSPGDQDLNGPIGIWDVQYASYVGNYGLSTCLPWCTPGGITVYRAAHDVMAEQGLSDDGQTADNEDDGGWEEYAVNTLYPNALIAAQQTTGAWEMNGWAHTVHDQQFVGFLEDKDGDLIDDDRLKNIVDSSSLPDGALPEVCGFTPDAEVSISATQASFCEVLFRWAEPSGSDDFNSDNYDDPCTSPTYACAAMQPAWYAQLVCKSTPATASGTGCAGGWWFGGAGSAVNPALADQPAWSDNDYDVWHWVVAPAPSACSGDQEPGFALEAGSEAAHPYLAHDLDVYVPAATAAGATSTENIEGYARNSISETVPGVDTSQVPTTAELAPTQAVKEDTVEPNAAGDTSQSGLSSESWTQRAGTSNDCDILRPNSEDFVDPWVDIVDNEVIFDAVGEPVGEGTDLYLTGDDQQDASNRPGIGQYYTAGKLGVFTDKNDDGEYDQIGSGNKVQNINQGGAYELIWDIELDGEVLENTGDAEQAMAGQGCTPGFSEISLTEDAKLAGYGPHTGLVQVLYLNEPTYLFNWITAETFPFPTGDTAFVFLSDGFEEFHDVGTQSQKSFVEGKVADALSQIPGVSESTQTVYPYTMTPEDTKDFDDQCGNPTGGFVSSWGFAHTCGGTPGGPTCAGDTVVTQYTFENQASDNVLGGGGSSIPALDVDGDGTGETFPSGINTWTDVDPLDGDAARNDGTCDRPTHHDSGEASCSGHQH